MAKSINPASEAVIAQYTEHTAAEVEARIAAAAKAQAQWRTAGFDERAECLERVAQSLDAQRAELSELMTEEMGKPLNQARSEIEKCAWACRHFAENAAEYLARRDIDTEHAASYVTFEPLGVVFAIMPWNYPFWQFFRFAAPAWMAGNGVVLKHAENVWGCAHAIERLATEAGFPEGLVATLDIDRDHVEAVIASSQVHAVTLTGSTRAGRAVAALAGENLKPCVLELGGSDPYVVLADAAVEEAAEVCVQARMVNTGQSCIAAKRFIVVRSQHREFAQAVEQRLHHLTMGDPRDDTFQLGPMAREDLRDELHRQVQETVEAGAQLRLGGKIPQRRGWYYPATLLDEVPAGSPAYEEELFGPVASILVAEDDEDALRIAADTEFGLGAAIFTADAERGRRLAEAELRAGCCAVNAQVVSDPRLPFGGIKSSGFGRELSAFGILEFVNVKSIVVD